ncbi:MAG TPA: APC family permease [Candidatus Dormibacteraeota bacterium]|nr:APC family permease [Candidatus Dormibacteraeota bacterium]
MADQKGGSGVTTLAQADADVFDVSQRGDVSTLRKHAVGLAGVLFLTVTGSAPISAMLFNTPLVVGYGNGLGGPAAFVFATIVLTIFSVGYVAMARKVTTAGGFYSFISHGLGRELGLGTGFAALVAYSVFEASLAGGFAYFLQLKLAQIGQSTGAGWLGQIQWPWLAMLMVVLISLITYFDIRITARLLGVFLVGEILFLLIFDVFMVGRGITTSTAFSLDALNPVKAFQGFGPNGTIAAGLPAIGLFFAFWSWVGFEMAPNYGEESTDPKRIVPRAMYISVIGLGLFYILTSWAPFAGYPNVGAAIAQAQTDPAHYYLGPATSYIGLGVDQALSILIITGSFACGMAFHNTAARYFYSLGRERVLPAALGRTHPRYKSPHIASIVQSVIAGLIVIAFAVFAGRDNPTQQAYLDLYGLMAVMGVIVILAVQALVSAAILVYFWRHHGSEVHWWSTVLAPIISFAGQAVVLILLFQNISFIAGTAGLVRWLGPIDAVIFIVGIGLAFYLKSSQPDKYKTLGRLIHDGL